MNESDKTKMKKALLNAEQRRTSAELAMGYANNSKDDAAYLKAYEDYREALNDIDTIQIQIEEGERCCRIIKGEAK